MTRKLSLLILVPLFSQPMALAAENEVAVPAVVSREAAQAMVDQGAEVEQVSEDEAIARAASHGVKLKHTSRTSPDYGRPWAIIKTGVGFPSGINLLAEVYVHDNWSVEAGANITLSYGAAMIGTRWHPDKLCWGCGGKISFNLSPGLEIGRAFQGEGSGPGTIITGSGEAELRYRPAKHFILSLGVRESLGTYIDDPGFTTTYTGPSRSSGTSGTPPPPPNPIDNPNDFTKTPYGAKATFFNDTLIVIGFGF